MLRLFTLATLASLTSLTSLGACDSTSDAPGVDASSTIDGVSAVDANPIDGVLGTLATQVDCAGLTPIASITYSGDTLTPRIATVAVGQVVRFHLLGNHTAWESSGLWSASGDAETCVRFDGPGVYNFYCYFHMGDADETGSITVE